MPDLHKDITLKLLRYKPAVIDPPRFQSYRLTIDRHMTVLDCLESIRLHQDRTLMYRHSCHHSSCGTCACIINGSEALACTAGVWEMDGGDITVEPLKGFERVADLVVNMAGFYRHFRDDWTVLRPIERPKTAPARVRCDPSPASKTASSAEAACRPARRLSRPSSLWARRPWLPYTPRCESPLKKKRNCWPSLPARRAKNTAGATWPAAGSARPPSTRPGALPISETCDPHDGIWPDTDDNRALFPSDNE